MIGEELRCKNNCLFCLFNTVNSFRINERVSDFSGINKKLILGGALNRVIVGWAIMVYLAILMGERGYSRCVSKFHHKIDPSHGYIEEVNSANPGCAIINYKKLTMVSPENS